MTVVSARPKIRAKPAKLVSGVQLSLGNGGKQDCFVSFHFLMTGVSRRRSQAELSGSLLCKIQQLYGEKLAIEVVGLGKIRHY